MPEICTSISAGLRTVLIGGLLVGTLTLGACSSSTAGSGSAAQPAPVAPSKAASAGTVSSVGTVISSSTAAPSSTVAPSSAQKSSTQPASPTPVTPTSTTATPSSSSAGSTVVRGTPAGVRTVIHRYLPWTDGHVGAGIKVAARSTGSCLGSIASGRSDAARCFFGNFVADPCFVDPADATEAICPTDPTEDPDDVTVVTLDSKAETSEPNVDGLAWLAETTGGVFCQAYTGAGSVTDGIQNWGCTGGELTMAHQQSSTTWTGMFTPTNSKKSTKVSMSEVWT